MRGISSLSQNLLASQNGLCSVEIVNYSICYICDVVDVGAAVLARVATSCTTGDKLFARTGAYIL